MPVSLAPYPHAPVPYTFPNGVQSQLICSGCRNLLLYPHEATSVCCAVCNAVTPVPLPEMKVFRSDNAKEYLVQSLQDIFLKKEIVHETSCSYTPQQNEVTERKNRHLLEITRGTEMAQLLCGGCHTLLMYIRGAASVRCSCCHTINMALEANQVAHVNCGNCHMLLMYQYGAQSVKCAVCKFVTSVGIASSADQKVQ